jgi:hypothetical protein
MSKLNKSTRPARKPSTIHKNYMGGNSWDITNPFLKLRMIGASSFFGEPKYYNEDGSVLMKTRVYPHELFGREDRNAITRYLGQNILDLTVENEHYWQTTVENVIDTCLNRDPEETLKIAVELRNVDMIRTLPQVILVRTAMHWSSKGTGLVRKYAKQICVRGDEPAVGLAYLIATYGASTSIPNALKKGWKDVLETFDDYTISKYKMNKNFVKTRDVVNLVHAYSTPIHKLMNGESKQERTWNAIVSNADKENKNPKEIWTEAAKNMPHMALLRNLCNLIKSGVDMSPVLERLVAGVEHGKQLPFRYYSAYKTIKNSWESAGVQPVLDALEICLKKSFKNAPHFSGKTMVLSDNSGSAWGSLTSELGTMHVAEIGNLMAVMTGMLSDEAEVGVFGDNLFTIPINQQAGVFETLEDVSDQGKHVGGGTENGIWLFFRDAIANKTHYDNIFVYSDMQAGHGGLYGKNSDDYSDYTWGNSSHIDVPHLINEYRQKVNPNAMIYLIQTAGYDDILVPECYDKTVILGGWSPNILQFASKMEQIYKDKN